MAAVGQAPPPDKHLRRNLTSNPQAVIWVIIKIPVFSPRSSSVRSPVPAFRFTGVIPLLWPRLSHSTPDTQFRVGSLLQAGLYASNPLSSPDYHAFKATVLLIPPWRWQRIATGGCFTVTGLRSEGVLMQSSWSEFPEMMLKTEGQIWLLRSKEASYHGLCSANPPGTRRGSRRFFSFGL